MNRIFRAACRVLLEVTRTPGTQDVLRHCLLLLDGVDDVEVQESDFSRISLNRQSERFEDVLRFCRLILSERTPTVQAGGTRTFSLLFDMNKVFERFVAAFLRRHVLRRLPGVQVFPQAAHHKRHLMECDGTGVLRLDPDVLVEAPASRLVMDTKWKLLAPGKRGRGGVADADLYRTLRIYAPVRLQTERAALSLRSWPRTQGVRCPRRGRGTVRRAGVGATRAPPPEPPAGNRARSLGSRVGCDPSRRSRNDGQLAGKRERRRGGMSAIAQAAEWTATRKSYDVLVERAKEARSASTRANCCATRTGISGRTRGCARTFASGLRHGTAASWPSAFSPTMRSGPSCTANGAFPFLSKLRLLALDNVVGRRCVLCPADPRSRRRGRRGALCAGGQAALPIKPAAPVMTIVDC